MKKIKVTVVTCSRSEYGILKEILNKLNKSKNFNFQLIVGEEQFSKDYGNTIDEIISDKFENLIINNKIKQKINILSKKYRQRDLSLDLYLVEKNVFDGSIKSNYQRMIEGKKTGKVNRYFDEREEEGNEI